MEFIRVFFDFYASITSIVYPFSRFVDLLDRIQAAWQKIPIPNIPQFQA